MEFPFQKTKVVVTVGPASKSYDMLLKLARAGANVFRLNFSHSSHEEHLKVINNINYINNKYNAHLGILADLQGPKLRIGMIKDGEVELIEGEEIIFTTKPTEGTKDKVHIGYEFFAKDVKAGETVLVDDGKLMFEVVKTNRKDTVVLKVLFGGMLSSRKGVNLPQTAISLPSLTDKDKEDLAFILQQPSINWIALSFVRFANDIVDLRRRIQKTDHLAKIIAKIEKPEALDDLDTIIDVTDGVMVARGDLGVEVPMEKLPLVQKKIIKKCLQMAKPVIVATQMMDSMIVNPSPTRAEITDVANAVLDGADAVMLSGETSVGKHPIKVVEAMNKIIAEMEDEGAVYYKNLSPRKDSPTFFSDAICYNACKVSEQVNSKTIIGMTKSGYTAFMVSSYRPNASIFIFSDDQHILSTLNLVWGIRGMYYDKFTTTDETISDVHQILQAADLLKKGDIVINTGSMPLEARLRTNMLKITIIED